MMIVLHDVYETPGAAELLWELLAERDPIANISHKQMPTREQHFEFVRSKPYTEWWFIGDPLIFGSTVVETTIVGACYLTRQNEIGIQIAKRYQRRGWASKTLVSMIDRHKGKRLLANVAPGNEKSFALFKRYGFTACQVTLELDSR